MAITLNGKLTENENNASVASLTITNSGLAINAGDAIVVIYRGGNNATGQVTVSDNQNAGNYTKSVEVVDGTNGRTVCIFIMPNSVSVTAGSLTVTASSSTSVTMGLNGMVYTGVATSSPTDQTNSAVFSAATTTPSSGNITTTAAGDLVVGAFGISTGSTATVSSEGGSFAQEFNNTLGTASHQHLHTADQILSGTSTLAYAPTLSSSTTGIIAVASFLAAAGGTIPTVLDDGDAQSQRFSQISRMESQHQQELSETFAILPTRPPFAYEDDGANMRWSDWRALHYEDPETQRALPPIPPVSIQEEFTEEIFVDWRARQYEDTDTHRALPPTPPFAIQDEHQDEKNFNWSAIQYEDTETQRALPPTPPLAIQDEVSERVLPGIVPFFEEDQPGKPIVAAAAPNIGLDDIEAHVKAYDRTNIYHEDDFSTFVPTPPVSIQDDEQHTWRGWLSPAIEDDARSLPPVPPFAVPDDTAEKWTASSAPAIEDDQATIPPIPPLPPSSIQDDEQHTWRGWLSPAIEDDWSARAPIPPLAFEDDLKTIAPNPIFFSYSDTDFTGRPPVPFSFGDDDQSLQRYMVGGLSALILLDEFVGAPIVSVLGPPTLSSLSAAIRPGIDAQNAAVRSAVDSQGAATRPAIDSQGGIVRPS